MLGELSLGNAALCGSGVDAGIHQRRGRVIVTATGEV
jgi:hypothetical protein